MQSLFSKNLWFLLLHGHYKVYSSISKAVSQMTTDFKAFDEKNTFLVYVIHNYLRFNWNKNALTPGEHPIPPPLSRTRIKPFLKSWQIIIFLSPKDRTF